MRLKFRLTTSDKLFFIVIALCPIFAMGSMTAWLVLTMPTPDIIQTMLDAANPQTIAQPDLQYGRGHTMTNTAGIHGETVNSIWFVPALFLLALTNVLLWTWFYTTRLRIKVRRKVKVRTPKQLIPSPTSA